MRPVFPLVLAAMAVAGTCDRVQPPPPAPYSVVYFDSGALVRAHLRSGDVVTGRLLTSFAPGGDEMVVCAERLAPCARTLPLDSIERVRSHETAAFVGADLGFRVGLLAAVATVDKTKPNGEKKTRQEFEDDALGPAILGALVGGALGALIGSRINVWPTLAERTDQLNWLAGEPVLISPQPAKGVFATACAREGALPDGRLVAVIEWPDYDAYSVDVSRAWELDSSAKHLVATNPAGVRCRAPYSRTPEPPVAHEREAAALTFTPTEGRARIYVRQTAALPTRGDTIIGFNVAIDGQFVGRTWSGTYLMAEVPPGPHTVTIPGIDTTVVSFEAKADSSYFVKLSHQVGWRRPKFRSLEPINRIEGRRLVRMGRLVPPAYTEGPFTIERTRDGLVLHNASSTRIPYFIVDSASAAPGDTAICLGDQCPSVPPLGSVTVADQRLAGFDDIPRDPRRVAVVYWWQERARRVVVPF